MNTLIELCILIGLLYTLIIMFTWKRKKTKQKGEEILALELSREELYKSLNFMLMYGIIDINDYNKIEVKSLSYLKG
jgi:hypothetical protein